MNTKSKVLNYGVLALGAVLTLIEIFWAVRSIRLYSVINILYALSYLLVACWVAYKRLKVLLITGAGGLIASLLLSPLVYAYTFSWVGSFWVDYQFFFQELITTWEGLSELAVYASLIVFAFVYPRYKKWIAAPCFALAALFGYFFVSYSHDWISLVFYAAVVLFGIGMGIHLITDTPTILPEPAVSAMAIPSSKADFLEKQLQELKRQLEHGEITEEEYKQQRIAALQNFIR